MTRKQTHACPIAAALNELGDRWSLLIIREAFYGATRFGEFQRNTGISRNLLSDRLNRLVEDRILQRVEFADRGTNFAYGLTAKGRALETVMVAIQQWSDEHVLGAGAEPVQLIEGASGKPISRLQVTASDGRPIAFQDISFVPGPGADERTRQRLAAVD